MKMREYFEKVMQDYNQNHNGRSLRKYCSHMAAQNVAFMYSLYESCKLNDLNFFDYINDVLTRLMKGETDYKPLIPMQLYASFIQGRAKKGGLTLSIGLLLSMIINPSDSL